MDRVEQPEYTHGELQFEPAKSMEIIREHIRALDIPAKTPVTQQQQVIWKLNTDAKTPVAQHHDWAM